MKIESCGASVEAHNGAVHRRARSNWHGVKMNERQFRNKNNTGRLHTREMQTTRPRVQCKGAEIKRPVEQSTLLALSARKTQRVSAICHPAPHGGTCHATIGAYKLRRQHKYNNNAPTRAYSAQGHQSWRNCTWPLQPPRARSATRNGARSHRCAGYSLARSLARLLADLSRAITNTHTPPQRHAARLQSLRPNARPTPSLTTRPSAPRPLACSQARCAPR